MTPEEAAEARTCIRVLAPKKPKTKRLSQLLSRALDALEGAQKLDDFRVEALSMKTARAEQAERERDELSARDAKIIKHLEAQLAKVTKERDRLNLQVVDTYSHQCGTESERDSALARVDDLELAIGNALNNINGPKEAGWLLRILREDLNAALHPATPAPEEKP